MQFRSVAIFYRVPQNKFEEKEYGNNSCVESHWYSVLQLLSMTLDMKNHTGKKSIKWTSVFDKGQVIGLHQAGKSAREVSQMMAIGLKTVQRTIAQWKKDGEEQSFSGNS